jgi:hypothetical protein
MKCFIRKGVQECDAYQSVFCDYILNQLLISRSMMSSPVREKWIQLSANCVEDLLFVTRAVHLQCTHILKDDDLNKLTGWGSS